MHSFTMNVNSNQISHEETIDLKVFFICKNTKACCSVFLICLSDPNGRSNQENIPGVSCCMKERAEDIAGAGEARRAGPGVGRCFFDVGWVRGG
jgi:hypothetical protein